jgi:3-deoxy-D-manno-octulosonic-acid transferase
MLQLYSVLIKIYGFAIRVAALFNTKAALWVEGRKNFWHDFEYSFSKMPFSNPDRKLAWFHCASLGEFEQGRPILENFKKQHPDFLILLTFFSPSGYNVRKNYGEADMVLYLPLDTQANARRFVDTIKPDIVFWVKYEYWYNFLNYLKIKQVPIILVSAIFRSEQHFFKFYGLWSRKVLKHFTQIFVQNPNSKNLLSKFGIENVIVSGDTRFDRVAAIISNPVSIAKAKAFSENHTVLVAGSTWPADEELIFKLFNNNKYQLRIIIAPHEIHADHIKSLLQQYGSKAVLFSETNSEEVRHAEVLIIDTIGLLSQLYRYGTIAYIGGGFGVGIHNILEAAAFGLPVFFGPEYHKFQEAKDLVESGGASSVTNSEELKQKADYLLLDQNEMIRAGKICKEYVENGCGATEIILKYVNQTNLLAK